MKTKKNLVLLRWGARLASLPFIVFIGIQIFHPEKGFQEYTSLSSKESVMVLFFPLMYFIGLISAWKWDLIGGVISIIGLLVTLLFRIDLIFMSLVLSIPADLFILYWFLSKKEIATA